MKSRLSAVVFGAISVGWLLACGARTEPLWGAAFYAHHEDAGADASSPTDAGSDATDAADAADAPPPPRDAAPALCADASELLIYAITQDNTLLSFDPTSATFAVLGKPACADPNLWDPFSMAVDHTGVAFVEYQPISSQQSDTAVYRLSLATLACTAVQIHGRTVPAFTSFGMGFSVDDGGATETMYLTGNSEGDLGAVNEATLALTEVGVIVPSMLEAELSGTADGRLYAFNGNATSGSTIAQLDRRTAAITSSYGLPMLVPGQGWAFSFWGGDFYVFTSLSGSSSIVTRYRPSDGTSVQVATYDEMIVGAGASTCAPQE